MRGRSGIAHVIAIGIAAGFAACGSPSPDSLSGPGDGGGTGPSDGGIALADAPGGLPDAMEITDLATICGGHEPHSFDEWEDCYRQRRCEWEVGCVSLNSYRDVEDCLVSGDAVSGGRLSAERRERKRAVDDGTATINTDKFQRCLVGTSATHCNTALYDADCLTRYTGTVGDGGSCLTDVDCASPGAACHATCSDACCEGTCQPRPTEGQPCKLYQSCAPGLVCNGTTCLSGDLGTPCSDVGDCDANAWCDVRAKNQPGKCRPTFPVGAECTSLLQCGEDTSCIGASISSSKPGHCLRDSRPGDPCDWMCYGNLYCDGKMCRDLPALGDSCPPNNSIPCAGTNTMCPDGRCVLRSEVGSACGDQTCLPGLFCTSKLGDPHPTCAARRAEGAACNDPGQCESYVCSGNMTQSGICLAWHDTCP